MWVGKLRHKRSAKGKDDKETYRRIRHRLKSAIGQVRLGLIRPGTGQAFGNEEVDEPLFSGLILKSMWLLSRVG